MHSHTYCEASHTRQPTRFRLCFQQLFDYLHEYLQPWFKADVEAILAEADIATLRSGRFVGMHIRRTDKQIYDGAVLTETEVKNVTACRLLVPSGKLSNQFLLQHLASVIGLSSSLGGGRLILSTTLASLLPRAQVYFDNVARYLDVAPGGLSATDITGLWLSSDEEAVLNEVRH